MIEGVSFDTSSICISIGNLPANLRQCVRGQRMRCAAINGAEMKRVVWCVAVLLLGPGLAGCASEGGRTETPAVTAPEAPEETMVTAATAAPSPRPPKQRPEQQKQPAVAEAPLQTAAITPIDPEILVGRSREQTRQLLGAPKTVRDAQPATVWRFDADGCMLEIFFYMDLGVRDFRALSYDISIDGKSVSGSDAAGCVGRIRAGQDERHSS